MIRVLMVCTGNICRSPSAEAVLRHRLAAQGLNATVEVDSAGTEDWNRGKPPAGPAIVEGKARGYDLSHLRARQLNDADFTDFDLLLAMDRGHLALLNGRRRPEGSKAKVRLFMDFADEGPEEVPDPFYGDVADYRYAMDLIESAMPGLLRALESGKF